MGVLCRHDANVLRTSDELAALQGAGEVPEGEQTGGGAQDVLRAEGGCETAGAG